MTHRKLVTNALYKETASLLQHLPGWSTPLIMQSGCLEWSMPFAHLAFVILYCCPLWANQAAKFLVVGKSATALLSLPSFLQKMNCLIKVYNINKTIIY